MNCNMKNSDFYKNEIPLLSNVTNSKTNYFKIKEFCLVNIEVKILKSDIIKSIYMKAKFIFCAMFICLFVLVSQGQNKGTTKPKEQKVPLRDRLSFGGNFGLQLGNPTLIDLSPTVGYRVTEKFMPGLGVTYIYYGFNSGGQRYSTNVYGGTAFARYNILQQLFLHTEFEMLNYQAFDENGRQWVPAWLAGGGYAQPLGASSSVNIMVLWNLLERADRPSLYNNPIIRVGVNF